MLSTLATTLAVATPRCEGKLLLSQIGERQEVTLSLLRAKAFDQLQRRMDGFLDAYVSGTLSDEELFYEFGAFDRWSPSLSPLFTDWLSKNPRSFAAHQAMAIHLYSVAWQARGGEFSSETSGQQMSEFKRRLRESRDWSLRSIPLHPKPVLAYQLLMANAKGLPFDVALPTNDRQAPTAGNGIGGQSPRPDVLPILMQSIRLQPDNTIVREAYVALLAPRWGGSLDALLDFSRPKALVGLPPDRAAAIAYAATMEIASDLRLRERLDEAVAAYEAASRLCRLNGPLVEIGNIRLKQQRYTDALNAGQAALSAVAGSRSGLRINALALHGLGRYQESAVLLQRLAPDGSPDIIYLLGEYFSNGVGGMQKDPVEARRLFRVAAQGGNEKALKRLQELDANR
jgi:Domain of unknown function (DUF4034)